MDREISLSEAAISMEKKMAEFYRAMAENALSNRVGDVLKFLAGEEERHAGELRGMADEKTNTECLNRAFEESGEILTWLLEGKDSLGERSKELTGEEEVIAMAIQAEKDSVLFYHTLLKTVGKESVAGKIQDLIEFEYGHLQELYSLRNLLRKSRP
ncbi:MAG: ferritin family protein [Planctomycetota bacterium]|jgi:rubrerythrin